MSAQLPGPGASVAERISSLLVGMDVHALPAAVRDVARRDLIDVTGLCMAARHNDYVRSTLDGFAEQGRCTAIAHSGGVSAATAAATNGTAAHGEDYDDTLEGTPNHVGAVVIPAVLAACKAENRSGIDAARGIIGGMEIMVRMARVVPGGFHKACFHPTAITGTFGATLGVGLALQLSPGQLTHALGLAGSLCSGTIEYLAEGTWSKRLHAGWAAQSGIRAALLARAGFTGPRTIFEGEHNVFRAFSPSLTPKLELLTEGLGGSWIIEGIAFKLYACGTMIHPYIDCAIAQAERGVAADDIVSIECRTAEAIVHRLWEPLAAKQRPLNGYAGKFSVPYSMAAGFFDGAAGFGQYTNERVRDEQLLAFASKVSYQVDPNDPYPQSYTGEARVTLRNGESLYFEQPHFRGGIHEPLSDADLERKFADNLRYGDISEVVADGALAHCQQVLASDAPASRNANGLAHLEPGARTRYGYTQPRIALMA